MGVPIGFLIPGIKQILKAEHCELVADGFVPVLINIYGELIQLDVEKIEGLAEKNAYDEIKKLLQKACRELRTEA